jgi:hypothetical protein
MQSCDMTVSSGRLCTGETTDGDYARRIEWWWVRGELYRVCQRYGREIARKQTESVIMRNIPKAKQEKYAATNVFSCNMQRTTERQNRHLDPAHVFPSVGSRRLRPRLASSDFDAVDGAVDKMSHLLLCQKSWSDQ